MKYPVGRALALACAAIALALLSAPLYARASDGFDEPCHMYEYADGLVPQFSSFGSPSNLYDYREQLLMRVMCTSGGSAKVLLGNGDPGLLIYEYGFERVNGTYVRTRFTGASRSGAWIYGSAEGRLIGEGSGSVYAYMCKFVDGRWKCGCRDRACTRGYWQRQDFISGDVVAKDSVIRSDDSGRTFTPYFRIATAQEELGPVDVQSISFDPVSRNKVVVSSITDGLFYRSDDINVWTQLPFPPGDVHSFMIDAGKPSKRAFATGAVNDNGRVFRTDDWGATWRAVYAEPGDRTTVTALTQDPHDYDTILAGTSGGTVVRSTNNGDTWENIGQNIGRAVLGFTHDATKKSFVYLLTSSGYVYHSKDAGRSWLNWEEEKKREINDLKARARQLRYEDRDEEADDIDERVDELEAKNSVERIPSDIVYITADPDDSGVIYAGLTRGLYRSTDYGKYWKKINIIESAERYPIRSVAVNPNDSDEISFVSGSSFYRSTNYGRTWSVTPLDTEREASFVAYDPFSPSKVYVGLGED